MRMVDALTKLNGTASGALQPLSGGYYMLAAVCGTWSTGTLEVQMVGPDGSTMLSLPTPIKLTANGTIAGYIPPGSYQFVVGGSPGANIQARFVRIPGE